MMFPLTKLLSAGLAVILIPIPSLASPVVHVDGSGRIEKPGKCSPKIGSGANYIQGRTKLAAKCENGGDRPRLAKDADGNRYLSFTSNKASAKNNTRTELAYLPYLPFDKPTTIRFKLRIPQNSPVNPPGQMQYIGQLWQCAPLSPIAGIRLVPGTSHTIDFPVRLQNSATPVLARTTLKPGQWHQIEMVAQPSLNPARGRMRITVDGKMLTDWKGAYGSSPSRCQSPSNSTGYRVKFGIYRSASQVPGFQVHFDDLTID
jgi:hypothetical protein